MSDAETVSPDEQNGRANDCHAIMVVDCALLMSTGPALKLRSRRPAPATPLPDEARAHLVLDGLDHLLLRNHVKVAVHVSAATAARVVARSFRTVQE